MVSLADLKTRNAETNGRSGETIRRNTEMAGRNGGTDVHEGREYVATPPVDEQYAPEPRMVDPYTGEVLGLATMISGYSTRAKVFGVVFMLQVRSGTDMKNLIEELKRLDPATEFDTELKREFGQKGETKRARLDLLNIEARSNQITLIANGEGAEGTGVTARLGYLEMEKAKELLAPLDFDERNLQSIQDGLAGKCPACIMMAGRGAEFTYSEYKRDGTTNWKLVQFHQGAGKTT